jgi:hypothetical protein
MLIWNIEKAERRENKRVKTKKKEGVFFKNKNQKTLLVAVHAKKKKTLNGTTTTVLKGEKRELIVCVCGGHFLFPRQHRILRVFLEADR